jgi:hypothetical protein
MAALPRYCPSLGEIHDAHASLAEALHQPIGAETAAGRICGVRVEHAARLAGRGLTQRLGARIGGEQRLDLGAQRGVAAARARNVRVALAGVELDGGAEDLFDPAPAPVLARGAHGLVR